MSRSKQPNKPLSRLGASPGGPPRADAGEQRLTSYTIGALPLIEPILERMRLREALEGFLPPVDGRTKIAPAEAIVLLVKNYLISRAPLYGVGEWAAAHDPEVLGLSSAQIACLNDDRVGRCLSKLFDADQGSLALWVAVKVVREFGVSLDELHNDSTTVTFFGAYEADEKGLWYRGKRAPAILHGHNKDHRPDLKQLLFVLTTSADGSVPVHFRTLDGNTSDDTTHMETWELLRSLRGDANFLYVADCKLASVNNLAHIDREGGRFVTVLPRNRKEDAAFREQIERAEVNWEPFHEMWRDDELIDYFRIAQPQSTTAQGFRLLWIHSSVKEGLDFQQRCKILDRAQRALGEFRDKLRSPRTRWRDRAAVATKVEQILSGTKSSEWVRVRILEEEEIRFRQEGPGRRGEKTRYRRSSRPRFDLEVSLDPEALARSSRNDGIFPLVTNDREMSPSEILGAYKRQPLLEKRFSQFKSDFEVAPIFLKNADRVQALLCVYFFVLVAQALLEREMRCAMEKEGIESLPLYPEGRPCKRPCVRRMVDLFENVQRHVLESNEQEERTFVTKLSPLQKKLLRLAKIPLSAYRA